MPNAPAPGLAQDATTRIEQDAAEAGVGPRPAWAAFWFPIAGLAALLVAAVIFRPSFDRMLQEDYPVEWGQFSLCLFISAVSLLAAYHFTQRRAYLIAGTLALLALGTFVLAGEEISWGQRVLGLATPEELHGVNAQAEMNIHNITTGFDPEAAFRTVALLIGVVGTVLPFLARRRALPGRTLLTAEFWRVLSPPLFTVPLFAMMIGYRIFRLIVAGEVNFAVRLQEWIEFCQYLGLAITVACIYLKVRPAGSIRPGRRTLISVGGTIVVVTLVFAVFSALSGVRPGNAL